MLEDVAAETIKLALSSGADFTDVRVEQIASTEMRLTNDRFEQTISGVDQGVGVRVLYKGAWGFSASSSFKPEHIEQAVRNAVKAAKAASLGIKEKVMICPVKTVVDYVVTPVKENLIEISIDQKMDIALKASKAARTYDLRIVSADITYEDYAGRRITATSEGTEIVEEPSYVSLTTSAVGREGGKLTRCRERIGSPGGFEFFQKESVEEAAEKAAQRAVRMLVAKPPPAGRFTVVADPVHVGVFVHEAVGHACEADTVIAEESVLRGKIGQEIGSAEVTIYDDSTFPNGFGSAKYDAEGVATEKRLLVDRGTLKTFILNREACAKLGMSPNGGARATSYLHRPIVRMSNTYLAPGDYTFEELLEDVDYGAYVRGSFGGVVDTITGTFQFNAEEAFLIERGEITQPLIGVSLSGLILETLHNIDAVAKDFKLNVGYCGKESQLIPIGDGGPHVRIRNVLVGGR